MKKAIIILLTFCTLVSVLSSCSIRRKYYQSKYGEKGTEIISETEKRISVNTAPDDWAGQTEQIDPGESQTGEPETGEAQQMRHIVPNGNRVVEDTGLNPYGGMTLQELVDLYWDKTHSSYVSGNSLNTPYYYIFSTSSGGWAFNKLTGEFGQLCKDPVCTHESCVFRTNHSLVCMTVADDRIYIVMGEYASENRTRTLYSFDYSLNDAKLICSWSSSEDGPGQIYEYNGLLYYSGNYRKGNETESRVFVLDPASGKPTLMEDISENKFRVFLGVVGHWLYYREPNNPPIWRYDLDTGESECVVPMSVMHPEEGEFSMSFDYAETDGSHVVVMVLRQIPNDVTAVRYRVDVRTGQTEQLAYGTMCGQYIVFTKDHTAKEYQDDPFYPYYTNAAYRKTGGAVNKSGGEMWCMPLTGGAEECLIRISTDGVPDNLNYSAGVEIGTDGRFLYTVYANYKAYKNDYSVERGYFDRKPTTSGNTGYIILDLEGMKEYAFGPAHDTVWFPK